MFRSQHNAATRAAHENDVPEPMVELRCKKCRKGTGKMVRERVAASCHAVICGVCYYTLGMKPQLPKDQTQAAERHNLSILRNVGIGRR